MHQASSPDAVTQLLHGVRPANGLTLPQARCRALWDALRHGFEGAPSAMRTGMFAREDTWLKPRFKIAAWDYLTDLQAAHAEAQLARWLRRHLRAHGQAAQPRGAA